MEIFHVKVAQNRQQLFQQLSFYFVKIQLLGNVSTYYSYSNNVSGGLFLFFESVIIRGQGDQHHEKHPIAFGTLASKGLQQLKTL